MYDINDRRLHPRRHQALEGADALQAQVPQRRAQQLRLGHVDGDELEDAVLRDHVDDHGALGVVVDVDKRDAPRARLEHAPAGFVEGAERVDGDGLEGDDVEGFFDVCGGKSECQLQAFAYE